MVSYILNKPVMDMWLSSQLAVLQSTIKYEIRFVYSPYINRKTSDDQCSQENIEMDNTVSELMACMLCMEWM